MIILQFGDGAWGQNHKRILRSLGHKVVPRDIDCDPDTEFLSIAPDAVVITASSVNHFPLARMALQYKMPVFCEKPICLSRLQLEAYRHLVSPTTTFMAGHQLTFMKEIEENHCTTRFMFSERTGAIPRDEGAVLSLAVHDIAVAHYLTGLDSFVVSATGNKHNAKILLSREGEPRAEILVQSFANIRLRHMTIIPERGPITTIQPDNWNRSDLLELELREFCAAAMEGREPKKNSMRAALAVMNTVFSAQEAIDALHS